MSKIQRLEIIESTFIVLSALGTVAATVTKQVLFAAAPLTITIFLNSLNRKQMNELHLQKNQSAIGKMHEMLAPFHSLGDRQKQLELLSEEFNSHTATQLEELERILAQYPQTIASITDRQNQLESSTQDKIRLVKENVAQYPALIQSLADSQEKLQALTEGVKQEMEQNLEKLQISLTESLADRRDRTQEQEETLTATVANLREEFNLEQEQLKQELKLEQQQRTEEFKQFQQEQQQRETTISHLEGLIKISPRRLS